MKNYIDKNDMNTFLEEMSSDFFEELRGYIYTNNLCHQDFINLSVTQNFSSSLVRLSAHPLRDEIFTSSLNYEENVVTDKIRRKIQEYGRAMFGCEILEYNVPNVVCAQLAIIMGTCHAGDSILFFENTEENISHLQYLSEKLQLNTHYIPVLENDSEINMMELEQLLQKDSNIKIIMLDRTLELREESIISLRNIVPEHILIVYDCSHNAGLIASGLLPQPLLMGVDILYGSTNITVPGPTQAFIAYKDKEKGHYSSISKLCDMYGDSGKRCEHAIPLLITFEEMKLFGREYCQQIIDNTQAFAKSLGNEGFTIYNDNSGGLHTNQIYMIVGSLEKVRYYRDKKLMLAGIYVDISKIPTQNDVYGFKLGTQAMTRRGFKEKEFDELAKMIARLLIKDEAPQKVKYELKSLNENFPIYPLKYSFDEYMNKTAVKDFTYEVLR